MEPIISLPYSEYETIVQIQRYFKKGDGYSVFVPVSRQQKGIDFAILNTSNGKSLRFQVKGSRVYTPSTSDQRRYGAFRYVFWFNNFHEKYESGLADVYLLFGLYPVYNRRQNIKSRTKFWKSLVLAFSDNEMGRFLNSIRAKNGRTRDRFFYVSLNDDSRIVVTRGRADRPDISHHLLVKRVPRLLKRLQ